MAMKAAYVLSLSLLQLTVATGQSLPPQPFDQVTSREFLKQLVQDDVYNFISSTTAESLILHRVEPVAPHGDMMARVSGTVMVAFEIAKDGKVRHAMAVSGPMLLRAAALVAVRQWTFRPYSVQGKPGIVATSIPVKVANY